MKRKKTLFKELFQFIKSFLSKAINLIGIISLALIFGMTWVIIVNFTYEHQWMVLILDLIAIITLALALNRGIPEYLNFKKSYLFWIGFINTILLVLTFFGAPWNLLMLFVIFPASIMLKMWLGKLEIKSKEKHYQKNVK